MKHSSIKKLYYSISEVSKITGLEQYVLRYWETEFPELNLQRTAPATVSTPTKTLNSLYTLSNCCEMKSTLLKAPSK